MLPKLVATTSFVFLAACAACSGREAQEPPATTAGSEAPPPAAEPATTATDAPTEPPPVEEAAPAPVTAWDTTAWQGVLTRFVTDDGGFRYAALHGDADARETLAGVVASIDAARPDDSWSRDAQLAYYINAYNALTVNSVIELWPVTSVMQEEGFFDARTHGVAGQQITLNHLENEIIRARFSEPRIHFAVNCASAGCPWLDGTAFTAESLEGQLARLTQAFVRRTTQIDERRRRVRSSQIFEWFATDFEAAGGVREFIASQLEEGPATVVRNPRTRMLHFEYDWALNGRE